MCLFSADKSNEREKFGIVTLPFYKTCSTIRAAYKTVIEELDKSDPNHTFDYFINLFIFP
jgi:hypothetical protein